MTETSVGPKSDTTTKEKKPATTTPTTTPTTTKDKKSDATPDKKIEKKSTPETATHEGQKRVTDDYRAGWARIWKKKG
jgi:hypothetical protein